MKNEEIEIETEITTDVLVRCHILPGYPATRFEPGEPDTVEDIRVFLSAPGKPDIDITDYLLNDEIDKEVIRERAIDAVRERAIDARAVDGDLRYQARKEEL